jgi:hypothetical protein
MKVLNKTDKNRCNCVLWLRERLPELPGELWTLEDKENIINSPVPYIGAGAIIAEGVWFMHEGAKVFSGHVALVTDIEDDIITIQEANYQECAVTERKGTKADLKIVGFFAPDRIKENQMKKYYITSELRDELEEVWDDFDHEDKESQKEMAKRLDDYTDELEENEKILTKKLKQSYRDNQREKETYSLALEKQRQELTKIYNTELENIKNKQDDKLNTLIETLKKQIESQNKELNKLRKERSIAKRAFEIISNFLNRWRN